MNTSKHNGTRQLCGRMIDCVIDPIIDAVRRASNLTDDEKEKISQIIASSGHEAVRCFIYGIEDEPVGIEISHHGLVLNDQSFEMPTISRELSFEEFSRYDLTGTPKNSQPMSGS